MNAPRTIFLDTPEASELVQTLTDILDQAVSVAVPSTVNSDGELSYGTPVSVACRLQKNARIMKTPDGQDIISDTQILTLTAIGEQDRIWLPGQSTSDATLARTPQLVKSIQMISGGSTVYEAFL